MGCGEVLWLLPLLWGGILDFEKGTWVDGYEYMDE